MALTLSQWLASGCLCYKNSWRWQWSAKTHHARRPCEPPILQWHSFVIAFPWTQPALNSLGHHYSNTQKSTLFSLYLASSTVLRLTRTRFWKLPSTLVFTWGDCFVSTCFINVISPSVLTSYQETRCFGHNLEVGNRGVSSSAGLLAKSQGGRHTARHRGLRTHSWDICWSRQLFHEPQGSDHRDSILRMISS